MDAAFYKKLISISYSVIIASIIIIFITSEGNGQNMLVALLSGYGLLMWAILFIFGLLFLQLTSKNENLTGVSGLFKYLNPLFPLVILLFIISIIIYLLGYYFDRISTGKVSDYYYSYSTLSSIFLLSQLVVILNSFKNNETKLDDKTFSILMLLGTINMIIVITLGIILKFYTTDC